MKYISDDGKVFNTEQQCISYEKSLKDERIKQEELRKKQVERKDKIRQLGFFLMKEINDYENDYNTKIFVGLYTNIIPQLITCLLKEDVSSR